MPCNCGRKATSTSFVLTMPDGEKSSHATKLEAQAANVENGGGGTVTTKKTMTI